MLNLDATDNLEGIASVTNVVEFTFSGVDGTTVISSEGKLTDAQTTIHTATGITRVYSLTLVNTHSAAVTVTVTKDPTNAGTLYKLFSVSLGIGYSLVFDGARFAVFDVNGVLMQGMGVSDTAYAASWDGVTTIAPSKNAVYDQMLLQMLKTGSNLAIGGDADGDTYFRAASVLARLAKSTADLKMFMNAGATAPEWAAGLKQVGYTRDISTASGNQTLTGAGFTPAIAIVLYGIDAVAIGLGFGNGAINKCCGYASGYDNAPLSSPNFVDVYSSAGNRAAATLTFNTDGGVLAWTKTSSPAGTLVFDVIWIR